MIVVADTSPLNCLIQIESDSLLPQLYGRIIIPSAVLEEMGHSGAPSIVRAWRDRLPTWVEIRPGSSLPDEELADLGPGEREAIQVSSELGADLLLIDERKGRNAARQRGLRTTGTLGVLIAAARLGLVDAESGYRRLLAETTFRTSSDLEERFSAALRTRL